MLIRINELINMAETKSKQKRYTYKDIKAMLDGRGEITNDGIEETIRFVITNKRTEQHVSFTIWRNLERKKTTVVGMIRNFEGGGCPHHIEKMGELGEYMNSEDTEIHENRYEIHLKIFPLLTGGEIIHDFKMNIEAPTIDDALSIYLDSEIYKASKAKREDQNHRIVIR